MTFKELLDSRPSLNTIISWSCLKFDLLPLGFQALSRLPSESFSGLKGFPAVTHAPKNKLKG